MYDQIPCTHFPTVGALVGQKIGGVIFFQFNRISIKLVADSSNGHTILVIHWLYNLTITNGLYATMYIQI